MVLLRLLRAFTRPYQWQIAAIVVLLLLQTITSLYIPSLNADIVNKGVVKGDVDYIWSIGGLMVAVSFLQAIISITAVYLTSKVSALFARDVRRAVFYQVLGFSAREVDQFGNASLITRNTNDVQQVQIVLSMGLMMMVSAPITMVGGIIMALQHTRSLSWLIAVMIPVMAGFVGMMLKLNMPLFRVVQERIDRINQVLREQITGIRVIRAFVRDSSEQERFSVASGDLRDVQLRINRNFALAMPMLMLIINLSTIGTVWFGGNLVADGQMEIGDIGAFMSYQMQILMSVMMATMMLTLVPRGAASAERIQAVLDSENAIKPATEFHEADRPGSIRLENATFSYPGAEEPVLRNLSFEIPPGAFAAVVGGTGSGKTTLVNLLMRYFDTDSGAVFMNGANVRNQDLSQMWKQCSLVPQKALLFSGTIRDNVRFGAQDISDDEVWRALEIAQAKDFVEAMPDGLDSEVSQGGTNLSGGQKQRLAIARAIAMRPAIYVLDDAFSALDAATDQRLRHALHEMEGHATRFVVAQRISTVLHADIIIVLDDGEIAGIGKHEDLLANCVAYQEIVGSQLEVSA